jgi:ParB/RepB/Spo0J family partition protein
MIIEQRKIESIRPYPRNPRRNDAAVDRVAQSIREFGFNQPIVVDSDGVIVVGHTRFKAAQKLKLTEVPVLVATASIEKLQAYRLADNKLNELAEWDDTKLIEELKEIIDRLGSADLTGFNSEELAELLDTDQTLADHSAYSKKIDTPIYTPKGDCPALADLTDTTRTRQLLQAITASTVSDEEKQFLLRAADRHIVFDYHQIAEYYCHASKEMQALMEDSALVIIDFHKAIEQGYVTLSEELKDIYLNGYGDDDGLR